MAVNLFPDMLRVDSPTFGDNLIGHLQEIRGDFLVVRLELEDDHPAMQDAVADGFDPEQVEFIESVHVQDARTTDGIPYGKTREWQAERDRKDKALADARARDARARIEAKRLHLPELDNMLRSRHF